MSAYRHYYFIYLLNYQTHNKQTIYKKMSKQSKQKTEIRFLTTESQLKQAAHLLTESFIQLNQIWKNMEPKYEDIYPIFQYKMFQSMKYFMAYGFYVDDKMIGATANYQLLDYFNLEGKGNSKLFNLLAKYGHQVQVPLQEACHRKNQAIYGAFAAVSPQHSFKGYSLWFWIQGFKLMKQFGFKTYYSRTSSPISLFLLKKIGAQVVNEIQFEEEQVKGQKLVLIRLDLTKKIPELKQLKKMMKNASL